MLARLRHDFDQAGFLEVETPLLSGDVCVDEHIEPFVVSGLGDEELFLQTSPEFAMKKLLVGGMERIFQLCKTWRNAERSTTHHPEFTMLEWYRANRDWRAGAGDCVALIRAAGLVTKGFRNGTMTVNRSEKNCDLNELPDYLSVAEAFTKFCDIDLLATTPDPLFPNRDLLAEEAERLKVYVRLQDDWETIFFRLFLELIEPNLGCERPTVLYDWPLSMAALSRQSADDKRIAERFEIYVCGLELANGFSELIDAAEQRRRFEVDSVKKKAAEAAFFLLLGNIYNNFFRAKASTASVTDMNARIFQIISVSPVPSNSLSISNPMTSCPIYPSTPADIHITSLSIRSDVPPILPLGSTLLRIALTTSAVLDTASAVTRTTNTTSHSITRALLSTSNIWT